jgi:hypothetical protein
MWAQKGPPTVDANIVNTPLPVTGDVTGTITGNVTVTNTPDVNVTNTEENPVPVAVTNGNESVTDWVPVQARVYVTVFDGYVSGSEVIFSVPSETILIIEQVEIGSIAEGPITANQKILAGIDTSVGGSRLSSLDGNIWLWVKDETRLEGGPVPPGNLPANRYALRINLVLDPSTNILVPTLYVSGDNSPFVEVNLPDPSSWGLDRNALGPLETYRGGLVAIVPEPSTAALLGFGLLAALALRRRLSA